MRSVLCQSRCLALPLAFLPWFVCDSLSSPPKPSFPSPVTPMSKQTAAGGAGVGPSRRTWDVEAYTTKAREKDRQDKERAQDDEERIRKGKKPLHRRIEDLPQPTEHLKPREQPLDLDKDVGKTLMVDNSIDSRRGAGYYCDVCRKTCKDSIGYLDHINGRDHLRRLGQTTHVARSTVEQVRARIHLLREKTAKKASAKEYDFQERVRAIAEAEREKREERKRRRREEKEKRDRDRDREMDALRGGGPEGEGTVEDQQAMMSMMGFGGFGSSKK